MAIDLRSQHEVPKPLLASSIPDLYFDDLILDDYSFRCELDSDGSAVILAEGVFSVTRQDVGFADARPSHQHQFEQVIVIVLFRHTLLFIILLPTSHYIN